MEINFRADREAHLRMLCEEMGRTVDDFVGEAILTFMEDYEDGRDAKKSLERIEKGEEGTVSLEEMLKRYGLDDDILADGSEAARPVGQADSNENSHVPAKETSSAA